MKANAEFIKELENLYEKYENEINEALKQGYLKQNTAKTYLLHSENFIKWCKDNFEPGGKNK